MAATFTEYPHSCAVPYDEAPRDQWGWRGYWLCPECGTSWCLEVRSVITTHVGDREESREFGVSYYKVSTN